MRGEEPVVIPTEHAALVTPGRALTFGTDTAATGTPTAYPFEIFADKKKKSLVGYMALPTGSSGPSATAASPKAKKKKK